MCKCNQCHWDYDLSEFQENLEIPQIMKAEGLCFKCAFWKYQAKHDQTRPLVGVIPLVSKERYKSTSGVNPHAHYCLTMGSYNTLTQDEPIGSKFQRSGGVLTIEGYLFPYNGYSQYYGGITHQGEIPVNVRGFNCNAKFLTYQEVMQLLNRKDTVRVSTLVALSTITGRSVEHLIQCLDMGDERCHDLKGRQVIQVSREAVTQTFNLKEW